ncbi:Transmembrane domain-containing protein [Orpheovirus IHUMI-LCC2]|uniref:Transmembrane domain-containing protein n=1 Tax=Orpheovirus IHUMI-LCC2 TaxID=2023057 RepID=A0A2I2L543_9VIRU|nr:Transmembrane domain-containing protein [Orpheovirus IHUMI-LCC2]SNW62579.1 Transmembrane domain-containing protein [Orpheovirus IHUMI-LCC2]
MHRYLPLIIGITFLLLFTIPASLIYGIGIVHTWRPLEANHTIYTRQHCTLNDIYILYQDNYYLQFNVSLGPYTGIAYESIPEVSYKTEEEAENMIYKYDGSNSSVCYLSSQDMTIYINYDIAMIKSMILKLSYAAYALFGAAILPFLYVIGVIIGHTKCWSKFVLGDLTKDDALS